MRVRQSPRAEADIQAIFDYIASDSPRAAERVVDRVLESILRLADWPYSVRMGEAEGTRELVVRRTPYIAIYEVTDEVLILRVMHGARRRFPTDLR